MASGVETSLELGMLKFTQKINNILFFEIIDDPLEWPKPQLHKRKIASEDPLWRI